MTRDDDPATGGAGAAVATIEPPASRSAAEIALARANKALSEEIAMRRQIEEELRRRDRFLESIIDHVPDMIFLKDARELRFVQFNRAGEQLLGYRRDELLGKNDYDFFPKDEADFFTESDRAVLRGGALHDIPEEPIHSRTKGLRWLHTRKIPLRGDDGEPSHLLGISEDVTARKQAEDARRRAEEELQKSAADLARSNEELEQFAYVASHDLQEPLRKIQAFSDLLLTTCGPQLGPEGQEYLGRILAATNRMRTLVQDLLALSRVTSKARPFIAVDLATIARETLADLELSIDEHCAEITVLDLPTVRADPAQMRQLFLNLIGNALKFAREGEAPRVTVSAREGEERIDLSFEDNGIGFEQKYAERIFKPFQRLHASGRYPGSGIGLAICKKIVERHGGTISAKSEPGRGATFLVSLPVSPSWHDESESELR